MTPAIQAILIIAAIVLATIAFALYSVRHFKMEPQEFIVGGRSFGSLLLWILLAGEIYTSFTFLGAAGYAYQRGAPSYYILAYGTVGYVIAYFYLPRIWQIGKARGLMTWPDFLIDRYDSKTLGVAIAVLQFFLSVPYITLQLSGLQTILKIAGYGALNTTVEVSIAFLLIALFVFTAGIRGAAWASVVKDTLVLGAVLFAGVYLPLHFFGSSGAMFARVAQLHPHWLSLHAGSAPFGANWYISTVMLTAIGFFMGPANAQAVFSAKSDDAVRRNMIFMPLYQIVVIFVLLAGFTALVVTPGLKGSAGDQSFLLLLQHYFPPFVLGLVGAAGCLAGLLPASALLMGAASIFARNVAGNTRFVRPMVLVCAVFALILWLFLSANLVDLLLFYYNGITQLAPGIILGVYWRRVSAWAVGAGVLVGELVALYYLEVLKSTSGPHGINPGLIALAANIAFLLLITWIAPRRVTPAMDRASQPV